MGRDWSSFLTGKTFRKRPLLKDPFAVFSAPWFVDRLGCQVILLIRHPAAFAGSLKRLGWTFNFNNLLEQPLLMKDWLEPLRAEIETAQRNHPDIVSQASLLWLAIYQVVTKYRKLYPQIQLYRHEDLSMDPLAGFSLLYKNLGLDLSQRARNTIISSSSSGNPKSRSDRAIYTTSLDSQANIENWKRYLDNDEVRQIRQMTVDVASHYYPDKDWD